MHLLQAGNDVAVVALWLGHTSPATTHEYLEADLDTKQAVLQKLTDPGCLTGGGRYRPSDRILAFLDGL